MGDRDKDKEQVINELINLRKKIVELESVRINHKQAEKQLIKSEEQYRLIAESTSDVISLTTFNLHPVYTYVSSSVKVSTGYEPEELLGKSPFEFIHPDDKKKLFPILKNYVNAKIKKLLTGKELPTTKRIEFRFKDKEGNWRYLQSAVNIVGNKLLFITRDITEYKKAEEKMKQSEEKYRNLFENMPGAYYRTDREGNLIMINPEGVKLFGYNSLEDILGKNIAQHLYFVPEERKKYLKELEKNKGNLKDFELTLKKKDSTPLVISDTSHFYYDREGDLAGVEGIFVDITERQRMLNMLKTSEERFRDLFENANDAIWTADTKGRYISVNRQFRNLLGFKKEELIGKKSIYLVAPESREKSIKNYKKTLAGKSTEYEVVVLNKKGERRIHLERLRPLREKDRIVGVQGIGRDITERKQNERLQQVLYNISQAANSPISLKQLYKTIHKELGTIIDTTNFYIALVNEKEDKIYFPYYVDEKDNNFPILKLSFNNTPTTHVIKTGQPFLINRKQLNGMVAQETLAPWGTITDKSVWLGVPLKVEDRIIGAMVVQSYTNPELYIEKDIKLMEFVSSQVATAIERKSSEERIKHLSFHDSLTGLYNRAYFEEELERYNFPRYYPLSIVMLDVNGLKVINDTFGHQEGDRLLQHLSQILTSVSRQGDILARIGGDEFAILLPSTTSEEAHKFCQRIKKACQQDKIELIYLRPNISLGHATQEGKYKDVNSLLKVADRNMYQDKLFNGKSREKHFLEAFRIILAERDPHTSDHAQRLQELALSLGKRVGLTEYQLGNLKLLALLHDIGKIGIPDSILFKTYTLTPSEWKKMREHSRIGYRMAKNIPDFAPIAREILYHHEHWDGNGYPDGLKGEDIPLLSRIISIVDAYDVMQSRRSYKGAVSKTEALKEIKKYAGTQFDPQLVEIFLKIVKNKKNHLKNVRPNS